MTNGLYAAATALAAHEARADALANDIANLNTTGYKKLRFSFRELLYNRNGGVETGAGVAGTVAGRSFGQGALWETGDPLALAIDGAGFFQVRRQDGSLALTRAGEFRVDARGAIVTPSGERLQPSITLPKGVRPAGVRISGDGRVEAGGREIGKIVLVNVPAPNSLQSVGDTLFVPTAASGAPRATQEAVIHQGFLEASNVDLTSLLGGQKGYELAARVIKMQDQMMETANGIRR